MIIKFSLFRLAIIFILIISLPLIQNQWLNLYLFNINNFSIYKLLYFLSGLICPILVFINSLNYFTFYKFDNIKKSNNNISGKGLFFISALTLFILSGLITYYLLLNLDLFFELFLTTNDYLLNISLAAYLLVVLFLSLFLLFKKTRIYMKKFILINFFIISILIWYSRLNNIFVPDLFLLTELFNIDNINTINIINILFLICIEILYYFWCYISFKSNLSDWRVPRPNLKNFSIVISIIFFYFIIILYYSLLY